MTRHPYDAEAPTAIDTFDAAQSRNDATRDLVPARTYLIPPIQGFDIHAKLMEAIRAADKKARVGGWYEDGEAAGLRGAYYIVFGEDAP